MNLEKLARARKIYAEQGLNAVAGRGFRRLMAPLIRFGTFYIFECDLRNGLPEARPVPGITVREGAFSDLHLLEGTSETLHTQKEAASRLEQGHRWFIAIEEATGKLANYRWVSSTTAHIPETGRDLVLAPGEAYAFDLVTIPEYRRRGIDSYTRAWVYDLLHRSSGINRVFSYIHPDNSANLAASRRFSRCIGLVGYVRIAGRGFQLFAQGDRLPEFRRSARKGYNAVAARKLSPRSETSS